MTSVSVTAQDKVDAARVGANDQCLLVQDAIWQAVSEAAESDTYLSLDQQAQSIATAYPTSGYSRQDIKDALVFAAVDEGVAVDIKPSEPADDQTAEFRYLWPGAGRRRAKKSRRASARGRGADKRRVSS